MRRILSLLLSAVLLFTLTVPAMAATVKQETTSTAIKAGEKVTVTVTLDEDVSDIVMYQYSLYYNKALFTMTGSTGSAVVSNPLSDKDGDYFMISFVDTTSEGVTISAGTLAALTFQANADMTEEQAASFLLRQDYFWDTTYEDIDGISLENGTVSVTVSPAVPEIKQYAVTLPENPVGYTITPNEGSASPVDAGGSYSFTVAVDTENYEGDPVVKANGLSLTVSEGVYTIYNIQEDQTVTVEGIKEQGLAADKVIYQNGSNGAQWPTSAPVYVNTLTLKGLSVADVQWDEAFENCTVTLHKKTATDASYSLEAMVGVNGNQSMISMFSANINGNEYRSGAFTYSGSLENGQAEIVMKATAANYSGTKTIHLVVDGVSQPEPENYEVTLTEGTGYAIVACEGSTNPVAEGDSFSFMVTVSDGYEGTPVVKANGTELTASNGIYTIENITTAQTVTVEGITAIVNCYTVTLTKGVGYTIAACEGSVSPVSEGGSFSFTVTVNNGYEGTPSVGSNDVEVPLRNGVYTIENVTEDQVVIVEGITLKANMYTVAASADVTATKGDNTSVSVNVTAHSNTEITGYNDYDISLSYDPTAMTYVSAAAIHSGAEIIHDAASGKIRVVGHGEAKRFEDAVVTLNFTVQESGCHAVTIDSAKIDNSGNAIAFDAPDAAISDKDTLVKVAYPVTLPENFIGDLYVLPGSDYRFTSPSEHYDVTVTVGGQKVDPSVDGLVFTIRGVNGDVVITAVGKTYEVAKNGENVTFTGEDTAQYGADYSFGIVPVSGYAVAGVIVQIGGTDVNYSISNGTYVISGSKITGDVTISVTTEQQETDTTQITFEGVDANEVKGGLIQYATNGQNFTFELNEKEGYVYTAKLGEEELEPNEGIYTIPGTRINGTALTVIISKKVYSFEPEVAVSQYIQLDGTVMWLITANDEDDNMLDYGEGNTMFWSDAYNAYCWLVVSDESEETVKQTAESTIVVADERAVSIVISYDYDVNITGEVDINDAQLTYDMYQAKKYADFTAVSMNKFLKADVNGDRTVNVEDAASVVAEILK